MLNVKQKEFVDHAKKMFGKSTLTVDELKKANKKFGCKYAPQWLIKNKDYKVGKSLFKLPAEGDDPDQVYLESKPNKEAEKILTPVSDTKKEAAYVVSSLTGDVVPKKDPIFVSFGNYPDIKSIVKSNRFYPVFITGLSGNGKTMKVENADLTAVNDSMKPGKIKQLFSKSMKGRIISRTLLNKFIDEVA